MARGIIIDDPADPRLDAYRQIRERDLAARAHFIAEGEVVLRVLVASPLCATLSVLITQRRVATVMPWLERLPDEVPVYLAAQEILDAIVGFPIHRGVLALGRRREVPEAASLLAATAPEALVVVLSGIANHDNIGGIFRNAAAFGAAAVLLDGACCDPLYRKAIRVSVGGTLAVPFARIPQGVDPLALLKAHGFQVAALSPAGAVPLSRLVRVPRMAILFGAEGSGLAPALLDRCRTVAIPMAAGFDSLNVATTSGIVMHHLTQGI